VFNKLLAIKNAVRGTSGSAAVIRIAPSASRTTPCATLSMSLPHGFFHDFGRIVPLRSIVLVGVEHAGNVHPSAVAENLLREDWAWAEVTPSGRQLERQAVALSGGEPPHMPK
jgi:hypothetical protein